MSIDLFVPEIWSTRLLRHLDASLVYAQSNVINRNHEDEISSAGDTVHIQKVGDPTIVDYEIGVPMTPERPEGSTIPLEIDRDKGFYVQMDDLDAVQVNVPLFERFTQRAGVKMAQVVDADVAARMVAGAHAGNIIGTDGAPVEILASGGDFTLYEFAVEAGRLLDEQDAPDEGRWMAISPTEAAQAKTDDGFIPAGDDRQHTGEIGEINGFTILKTTRTPVGTDNHKILFGAGNYATTFANQLVKTEAERLQGLFEDAVKGRNVWGAEVIEPETIGFGHVATDLGS